MEEVGVLRSKRNETKTGEGGCGVCVNRGTAKHTAPQLPAATSPAPPLLFLRCRSPYLWKDPDTFRPERFFEPNSNPDFGGKWAGE